MSTVPHRSQIEDAYKWKLSDLFASDEAWEEAYEAVDDHLSDLRAYEGRVAEDPETLAAILALRETIMRDVANVVTYARLRRDEDTTDQHYQALWSRAQTLSSRAASAASFIEPELQELDRETVEAFVEDNPDLETYEHYFDDVLRRKPHTLSPEVEGLLADLGEVIGGTGEVYTVLTNADVEFPAVEDPDGDPVRITLSNFTTLQKNPDREFRRTVYEGFYDEWAEYRNAVATAYATSVKADVRLASARNYETARAAALDDANVPVEVYDNLLETVRANLDALHRHADLKRDRLGVDELAMWDLYAPLTDGESPEVSYEAAKEHVLAAVEPLGEAYRNRMAEGVESRWIDVYETRNKQSGAYSSGTYDSQPYILMNYQDDVTSMYTLAHELGHSMHSELTSEHQPYVYSGTEIFVAEVASTVNESLLTHHLLETVEDERLRRHVLDESLERFRSTLYRQAMFADFERRTHEIVEEGGALTPDRLDEVYGDLKAEFYEPAWVDDRIAREWMRIPHLYHAFYVYQYATGISAAVALARSILDDGEPAADRYLSFLRKGSRKYPLDLLRGAGVDMASPEPVEAALAVYREYVVEFDGLG